MPENKKIEIRIGSRGKGVFATESFIKDELILAFEKHFLKHSTNKTLRIDEHTHQLSRDPEAAENFINHSCEPNGYIDFNDLTFFARRKIKKGEELTYNYFTSDWEDEDIF